MAIYLTHVYGTHYYGPEPDLPGFDAARFLAYSSDYRTVHVEWDPPTGTFDAFRLVRNDFGVPTTEDDGMVLLEGTVSDVGYDDTNVIPGRIVYYAVFLKIGAIWALAGYTSCLHIFNHGSVSWLWERLPNHYRLLRGNHLTFDAPVNETLLRFISIIGWGLDRVRTSMTAAWRGGNPDTTHEQLVDALIEQFGLTQYPGLSGLRRRAIARDGAALAAGRGTGDIIEAAARTASGWDVTLRPSRNLMGSADRSQMRRPLPLDWDPSVHYTINDRVYFYGVSYKCIASANGYLQAPEGEGVANTWWVRLSVVDAATVAYSAASSSQHAWQGTSWTAGQPDTKVQTKLVLGIPKPADTTLDVNAITIQNNHSAALDAGARCLPVAQGVVPPDPMTVMTNAIPLPSASDWNPETKYPALSLVTWRGRLWIAYRPARTGIPPHQSSDRWRTVGSDTRLRLALSAFTHQPHADSSKAPVPAQMYMEFYDDRGKLISREFAAGTDTRVLDTYNAYTGSAIAVLGGRVTEYGAKTWVDQVAGFRRDSFTYGVVRPQGSRSLSTVNYGSANATVGATFLTPPPAGMVQALVLRYVSTTSYIRATRSQLQTVSGGVTTTLATYSQAMADGDRLGVTVTGNNYTVMRNGVTVATSSSTLNASSTIFGITVEP